MDRHDVIQLVLVVGWPKIDFISWIHYINIYLIKSLASPLSLLVSLSTTTCGTMVAMPWAYNDDMSGISIPGVVHCVGWVTHLDLAHDNGGGDVSMSSRVVMTMRTTKMVVVGNKVGVWFEESLHPK